MEIFCTVKIGHRDCPVIQNGLLDVLPPRRFIQINNIRNLIQHRSRIVIGRLLIRSLVIVIVDLIILRILRRTQIGNVALCPGPHSCQIACGHGRIALRHSGADWSTRSRWKDYSNPDLNNFR